MQILKSSGPFGNFCLTIAVVVAVFFLTAGKSTAQLKNFSISFGLATTQLLNDNPGAKPMFEFDSTKPPFIGGSFDGNQPGVSLKGYIGLDDAGRFALPVGLDISYFHAAERIPLMKNSTAYYKHWVYIPSATLGLDYFFMKFPIANVRAYIGVEARASLILVGTWDRQFTGVYDSLSSTINTKSAATRFGGAARLGIEGEISEPWFINASFAWGMMNTFGRDDSRRELLTPTPIFESRESKVYNFLFSLMLQYKFQ